MCIAKSTQAGLESKFKTCNSKIAERKHLGNHFSPLGNLRHQKAKLDKWSNWMPCTEKGTMSREEPCLCRPKPKKRRHLQDVHLLKMWRNPTHTFQNQDSSLALTRLWWRSSTNVSGMRKRLSNNGFHFEISCTYLCFVHTHRNFRRTCLRE